MKQREIIRKLLSNFYILYNTKGFFSFSHWGLAAVFDSSLTRGLPPLPPRLGSLSLFHLVPKSSSNFGNFFYWWTVKDYIKVQKKKRKVVVLFSRSQQNRSHAVTAKKCTKKVQCTCKDVDLPIAFLSLLSFFPHFWCGGSIDINNGRFHITDG